MMWKTTPLWPASLNLFLKSFMAVRMTNINVHDCLIRRGSDCSQLSFVIPSQRVCVWHSNETCQCGLRSQTPVWICRVRADRVLIELAHSCLHEALWALHIKNILDVSLVCRPILSLGPIGWERPSHSYLSSVENDVRRGVAIALATKLHSIPLFDQALGQLLPQLHCGCGVCTHMHKLDQPVQGAGNVILNFHYALTSQLVGFYRKQELRLCHSFIILNLQSWKNTFLEHPRHFYRF